MDDRGPNGAGCIDDGRARTKRRVDPVRPSRDACRIDGTYDHRCGRYSGKLHRHGGWRAGRRHRDRSSLVQRWSERKRFAVWQFARRFRRFHQLRPHRTHGVLCLDAAHHHSNRWELHRRRCPSFDPLLVRRSAHIVRDLQFVKLAGVFAVTVLCAGTAVAQTYRDSAGTIVPGVIPLPYAYIPLGPGQHNISPATATGLTVPAGARYAPVCASIAPAKYATDGATAPT